MKRLRTLIASVVLAGTALLADYGATGTALSADGIRIVTIIDNENPNADLKSRWGFAAAVLTPRANVMFDTGPDGDALLSNFANLGVDPRQFPKLVISHTDNDHMGGVPAFVGADPGVEVYFPGGLPAVAREVEAAGSKVHAVTEPGEIAPGITTTGPMDAKQEQALLVETKDGLVVMTGCAHPGVVNVVKEALRLNPGKRMLLVMGGFHLFQSSSTKVDAVVDAIKGLNVEKVAPSHCSGLYARKRFKEVFGDNYLEGGAGLVLNFPAP
jgi:7,8-dihydropterin-6-yl-methyl-4-(beta-D-ribofuranosyl)aminobenzene 5'-phosphate synthase